MFRHTRPPTGNARIQPMAFTLLEVMVAMVVLTLGIATSFLVIQRGFQAVDTARNLTAAAQIMENEMERLRLKSWTQIQQLQTARDVTVPLENGISSDRFSCTRQIRDLKTDMKEIVLTASWHGYDGRAHAACLITRYCRNGLNDYYYTIH
ncbi:MAG: prepilin-type N-terminal cleavage/methylation domain-containing protein [Opitutaceae bacterium]|nr:prepilin-type N-terminal cleavage/methylation domain-containing protein [Opitutaceae bacterium]